MAIFEKFAQKEREVSQTEAGERAVKGPSLKEILANKEQSELFGEYLNEEGERWLGRKLASGELDRDAMETLAEKRKGFLEIMDRSKNISETLDSATVVELVASSPELQRIGELFGNEGIRNALKRHLPRMAITDRERFADLDQGTSWMKQTKEAMAKEEGEIKKLCKEYGISEDQYVEILRGADAKEIAEEVHDRLGWWQRKSKKVKTIQKEIEDLAGAKADRIKEYLRRHEDDMRYLGGVLEMTLVDNPVLHETLVAGLRGERVEKEEPGMAFSEMRGATKLNEQEVQEAWEKYQDDHADEHMLNDVSYEDALHDFSGEYTQKAGAGKKGFWAMFWAELFSSSIEDFLKKQ